MSDANTVKSNENAATPTGRNGQDGHDAHYKLIEMVIRRNMDGIREWVAEHGIALVSMPGREGNTILHRLAQMPASTIDGMRLLLELGATPGAKNDRGVTPLDVAAFSSNSTAVKLLLEYGANPNTRTHAKGNTPIIVAATHLVASPNVDPTKTLDTIEALLDAGADPSAKNNLGVSLSHIMRQMLKPDDVARWSSIVVFNQVMKKIPSTAEQVVETLSDAPSEAAPPRSSGDGVEQAVSDQPAPIAPRGLRGRGPVSL